MRESVCVCVLLFTNRAATDMNCTGGATLRIACVLDLFSFKNFLSYKWMFSVISLCPRSMLLEYYKKSVPSETKTKTGEYRSIRFRFKSISIPSCTWSMFVQTFLYIAGTLPNHSSSFRFMYGKHMAGTWLAFEGSIICKLWKLSWENTKIAKTTRNRGGKGMTSCPPPI